MATLTIADLDNGKRDLQTVDAVANSRAATATTRFGQRTTTLYEATRRIQATGDEVIRNLGFRVPVPYASGIEITDSRFTVTGPDGKVYAPLSAPFTTGAWDASQWYVLQNDLNDHKLLIFDTLLAAQTAAAVLPDGQLVEALDVQNRYKVLEGALVFYEFLPWKNMEFVTPELFGAIGGDATKDTAAFEAMLASGKWQFMPDPAKRYHINKNLDFGAVSDWKAPLNIECLLSDTGQHDAFLRAEGLHAFRGLDVSVPTGIIRRAVVSDDFYGGAKAYRKEFRSDYVRIKSADIQTGYSGDGAAAWKLANQDFVKVGPVEIAGFRKSANITDTTYASVGWTVLKDWYRGLQATSVKTFEWDGGEFQGAKEEVSGEAGNNAFVCRGVTNGGFGDFYIYDSGEHGIRVTARSDGAGGYYGGQLAFGNVSIYRPGKSGFKAHSGTGSTDRIVDLSIASLYVEDAGWELYAPGKTPVAGDNHYPLNVQTCDNVRIGSFVSKKKLGQYNGQNIILMRDIKEINILGMDGAGSYGPGIFANASAGNRDWRISGKLTDCGNGSGTGAGVALVSANNLNRCVLDIDMFECPSLYNIPSFSGSPAGPIILRGYYFGITGQLYQGVVSRNRIMADMRPLDWPNSSNAEYPIGATLLALSNNASAAGVGNELQVYVSNVSASRFVAVLAGQTPVEATGLQLIGTWLSCGRDSTTGLQLVRRTR